MPTLTVAITNSPPYVLLALALLRGADVAWDDNVTELSEPTYEGIKGTEQVRQALEQDLPGKEVSWVEFETSTRNGRLMELHDQIPLPPLPTLFESNSSFADVQLIFDALDDYLAYR